MAQAITIQDQEPALKPRQVFIPVAIFALAAWGIYFVAPFIVPHLPRPMLGWLAKTVIVALYVIIAQVALVLLVSAWTAWRMWRSGAKRRIGAVWRGYIRQLVFGFVLLCWLALAAAAFLHEDDPKRGEPRPLDPRYELLHLFQHP